MCNSCTIPFPPLYCSYLVYSLLLHVHLPSYLPIPTLSFPCCEMLLMQVNDTLCISTMHKCATNMSIITSKYTQPSARIALDVGALHKNNQQRSSHSRDHTITSLTISLCSQALWMSLQESMFVESQCLANSNKLLPCRYCNVFAPLL